VSDLPDWAADHRWGDYAHRQSPQRSPRWGSRSNELGGEPAQAPRTVRQFHARELRVATDPPLLISIDGEVLAHTPVTARVAEAAIEVAAPVAQILRR
jgi:hypothetical protein